MQYIWEYLDLDLNQLENKQRGDYLGHVQRVGGSGPVDMQCKFDARR